jgi:3-polyprenyl-4-hydroxybenzoate decarboxylase and related decarboxylases
MRRRRRRDVDVHDYEQVLFYAGANVDPKRDVLLSEGPLDHLDHAPERQFFGGKLGIDATRSGRRRARGRGPTRSR